MENISIRKGLPEDLHQICEVMYSVYNALLDKKLYYLDDYEHIKSSVNQEGYSYVSICKNKIVGFLLLYDPRYDENNLGKYLNLPTSELSKVVYLDSIAVLPEFRGRGLQKKMIKYAEECFEDSAKKYFIASVSPYNYYSRSNLSEAGYVKICQTKLYGGLDREIWSKKRI